MPTELILNDKAEKKQYNTQALSKRSSSTMKQNELSSLGKLVNWELNGWSSNGVDHQMVLIIQ